MPVQEPGQRENTEEVDEGVGELKVPNPEETILPQGEVAGLGDAHDSEDLDETLPYSQGEPSDFPMSVEFNEWLEEGVLPKLFKVPKKPRKLITLGLPSQLPSTRGRNRKVPTHLQDYVCK